MADPSYMQYMVTSAPALANPLVRKMLERSTLVPPVLLTSSSFPLKRAVADVVKVPTSESSKLEMVRVDLMNWNCPFE